MTDLRKAAKQALEALVKSTGELHRYYSSPTDMQILLNHKAITALKAALEQPEQGPWEPSDTAYRPGGLPQDFIKHEVDSFDDWSEWVCPDPTKYFMKCCDCGLVHEMQFNIVKYSAGDKCEDFDDPYVQAVFRARRTTPPAAQPEQVDCPRCGHVCSQRPWQGLPDTEIDYQAKKDDHGVYFALGALWAEAKLKERNNG